MNTQLQNNRQTSIGQDNLTAAQGQDLLPNQGSTVPSVLQMQSLLEQARAAQSGLPNIQPPSEEEISHNMWMASGIMGLVAALVSGNAAGGIAAGMTAALAVHDRGYDLRQRGEYVMELYNKGYSAHAILSWYETGDNKELDKERDEMDRLANNEINREQREEDRNQQREFHNDQMRQEQLNREQSQRNADRSYGLQVDNANRADARLDKQNQQQFDSELRKTIDGPKQKQYYMRMAEESMAQLEHYRDTGNTAGMAEAYHNVRNNLARASLGGGATLNASDIESATGLPAWTDEKANQLGILVNGRPSDKWMSATRQQITDDIKNEQHTITRTGQDAYNELVAANVPPDSANVMVNRGMVGTGIQPRDWSKPQAEPKEPERPQWPGAPKVGTVQDGYKYTGGNPADQSSWEKV
ncbi:hypothetical protein [Klebsiella michiganensis]|uniref:hypothetical protein n=1 Tax=Klebsiella michiganensis TaxID=1134687 RepID=UPI000D650E45|nr:hypothetical protein [Klebsiella michiganensis]MDL4446330.1 hypothetical protein [Klebsiella michiganensis]MDL4490874.1 hypothetical protein [Klebsiella michiganensis]MDL4659617.1 hypothetical protein [Klebsiella michiganensis]